MDDNTEVINETAFMLAEMLLSAVLSQQKNENGTVKIAKNKTAPRELLAGRISRCFSKKLRIIRPFGAYA